jgi:hypothetical protein
MPSEWTRRDVFDLGFRDVCNNPGSRRHQAVCLDAFDSPAYIVGAMVVSVEPS